MTLNTGVIPGVISITPKRRTLKNEKLKNDPKPSDNISIKGPYFPL